MQKSNCRFNFLVRIKVIRVLFVALFIGGFSGYTQGEILDQKISLVKENVSIASVLGELETKLNFTIGYSDSAIDISKIVSVNAKEKTLAKILRNLFPSKLYQFKFWAKNY